AVARLTAMRHDVCLDIVGPIAGAAGAAERTAVVTEAARLGVADRVRCVGGVPLDAPMPPDRHYDPFVLPPPPGEGIPRARLQAMASGLPVIASRVGGIPSLVTHERNGLLLDEPAAPAVAAALARAIDDGALRRRLIQEGYATARAHTLEAQAE